MNYENQQKRISFLSLHGHLMENAKKSLSVKEHDDLVSRIYPLVDALFDKYPFNGTDKKESITKVSGDEVGL